VVAHLLDPQVLGVPMVMVALPPACKSVPSPAWLLVTPPSYILQTVSSRAAAAIAGCCRMCGTVVGGPYLQPRTLFCGPFLHCSVTHVLLQLLNPGILTYGAPQPMSTTHSAGCPAATAQGRAMGRSSQVQQMMMWTRHLLGLVSEPAITGAEQCMFCSTWRGCPCVVLFI
jgi:hypothetical protein